MLTGASQQRWFCTELSEAPGPIKAMMGNGHCSHQGFADVCVCVLSCHTKLNTQLILQFVGVGFEKMVVLLVLFRFPRILQNVLWV